MSSAPNNRQTNPSKSNKQRTSNQNQSRSQNKAKRPQNQADKSTQKRKPAAASANKKNKTKPQAKTNNIAFKDLKASIEKVPGEKWVSLGYGVFTLYMIILVSRYIYAFIWLSPVIITTNLLIILITASAPFALWAWSTKYEHWTYWNRKKAWLYACIASAILTVEQLLTLLTFNVFVRRIAKIKVTENMTENMVVTLGRLATIIPFALVTVIVTYPIKEWIGSLEMQEKINVFKITHVLDLRKDKDSKYDLNIVKNLETGKEEVIHEGDRFVHMFINGQSGTGKTSSTITPGVFNDLNTKVRNMEKRHEALLQMLKAKKAYITGPYANNFVSEYNVRPKKKYESEYQAIYKKYPDCGMTVMAPNNSMMNTIIEGCAARNLKCNVIDPSVTYKQSNVIQLGIQNFYIPFGLDEEERTTRIISQAQNFSEVIVAANEQHEATDTYFRDINTSVTTNIAIICMLAANIEGRQTNIAEIQGCLTNFNNIKPLVNVIENYFDIQVQTQTLSKKGKTADKAAQALEKNRNKNKESSSNGNNGFDNPYINTLTSVKQELLGEGAEQMFSQARGLRNLLDKFTLDPRYKKILMAPYENAIDFDRIFYNNEITLINTARELGAQVSTGLGLFFLLNFECAAVRRPGPEDTRSNHFIWVDEASQYMHTVYDDMFSYNRQFRVSVALAMQSTSQMDKSKQTSYIKSIILGAGIHILFGRVSTEEMKQYEELAGVVLEEQVQKTVSRSSSLISTNANQTEGERYTPTESKRLKGSDIRIRDFQEVSVFMIKDGRVLGGYLGKCNFLNKKELQKRATRYVNFAKFAPKGAVKKEVKLTTEAKDTVSRQQAMIKEKVGNSTVTVSDAEKQITATKLENAEELKFTEEEIKQVYEENTTTISDIIKNQKEDPESETTAEDTEKAVEEFFFGNLFDDTPIEESELITTSDELGDI